MRAVECSILVLGVGNWCAPALNHFEPDAVFLCSLRGVLASVALINIDDLHGGACDLPHLFGHGSDLPAVSLGGRRDLQSQQVASYTISKTI